MFKFLRKGATSIFAKVFLAIVVIVFIFWGIGSFVNPQKDIVAKVDGQSIKLDEFQQYYNFQLSKLNQTFGQLSEEDIKKLNLKQEVLNQLIKMKLLEKYAKSIGINVPKYEIDLAISQIPLFTQKGVFDKQTYYSVLRELGLTPKFFEYLIYHDLLQQRFKFLLTVPIIVSEEEIKDYIKYNKQELYLLEGALPLSFCKNNIKYTEKDLENFYLARKNFYKEEEKVKIGYYFIPYDQNVEITLEEAKKFYEANLNKFKSPFRAKLKTIFIPENQGLERAQRVKEKLKSLEDFNKYEKVETSWFEESSLPPEIASVLKQAREGQILGPFKTSMGYVIIGVEKLQPEGIVPFEKVKEEIVKHLKNEKIKLKTQEKVNKIYAEVLKENSLVGWAEKNRIKLVETEWLSKKEFIEKFGEVQLARKVFEKNKGEFFPPFETNKGFVILTILDKKPSKLLSFEEVKARVKEDFLNEKGKNFCEEKVNEFINKNKEKHLTSEDFTQEGFSLKTYVISRENLFEKFLPTIATVLKNRGKTGLIDSFFWEKDYIKVFYIKEIKTYQGEIKEDEIFVNYNKLLSEKRERWFNYFYQLLNKKSKVKVYPLFEKF